MDLTARSRWVEYSKARDAQLAHTNTPHAPWYIVDANVKRHARLNVISHLLSLIPHEDLTPEPIELPPRQKTKNINIQTCPGITLCRKSAHRCCRSTIWFMVPLTMVSWSKNGAEVPT